MSNRQPGTTLRTAAPLYVEQLPDRFRPSATAKFNGLLTTANRFTDEVRAAEKDQTLTSQGRGIRKEKARTVALTGLDPIQAEIKTLTDRADAIEKSMLAKVVPVAAKDPVEEMQRRELRDQLRELSASERVNVYRSTADPLIIAAIETAPATVAPRQDGGRRIAPFVDPTEIAQVQMARAQAADPAAATQLRELRELAQVYRLAVNTLRQEIAGIAW